MTTTEELLECLERLGNLNPDLKASESSRLVTLARQADATAFEPASKVVERLMDSYLHSGVKVSGAEIMKEYFYCMEQSAKQLRASGEISAPLLTESTTFSTALVPREHTEALDFCKVLNRSEIPKPLVKAADAFRRRNQIVDTVFLHAFRVLWIIDAEATSRWLVDYFEKHDGSLDPDIARDALASALVAKSEPSKEFIQWALKFAADPNLLEYWPMVTRYADRFLCISALREWNAKTPRVRNNHLAQLSLYIRTKRLDEENLLSWCKNSLDEIGSCVQRFMSMERTHSEPKWRAMALMTELRRISNFYVPIMIVLDQLLALPDGTSRVAMAFLGLAGETLEAWEMNLEKFAERAVRRTFMLKLKFCETPVDTIRLLTFGDQKAFNTVYSMLDLMTEKFDSIQQREKAVAYLSVFYASYRRPQILGEEIGRRYRNLMRMLHEDFLKNQLDATQYAEIESTGILQELASIAAEARKYLGRRQASENTLEQMMAAKIAFERFIREKRIAVLRTCL